jgi:hypothetical protein
LHQSGEEVLKTQIHAIVRHQNAIQQVPRPSASPRSPVDER